MKVTVHRISLVKTNTGSEDGDHCSLHLFPCYNIGCRCV